MTSVAWNWLPEGALSSPEVLALVDGAVERWNRRWFSDWRVRRRGLLFVNAPAGGQIFASTPKFTIGAPGAAAETVMGQVMDMDVSRLELGDGDHAILDALREEVFRDLARELDLVLAGEDVKTPAGADDSGPVLIDLADEDGRKILWIETSRGTLAETRRQTFPALANRPTGRLTPLRSAIADTTVALSATVGSAVISLPEARKLAPGDVIVLDRLLDQPIDLVAALDGVSVACATLVDASSPRSLRLESAASRDRQ